MAHGRLSWIYVLTLTENWILLAPPFFSLKLCTVVYIYLWLFFTAVGCSFTCLLCLLKMILWCPVVSIVMGVSSKFLSFTCLELESGRHIWTLVTMFTDHYIFLFFKYHQHLFFSSRFVYFKTPRDSRQEEDEGPSLSSLVCLGWRWPSCPYCLDWHSCWWPPILPTTHFSYIHFAYTPVCLHPVCLHYEKVPSC